MGSEVEDLGWAFVVHVGSFDADGDVLVTEGGRGEGEAAVDEVALGRFAGLRERALVPVQARLRSGTESVDVRGSEYAGAHSS